jgi:hypothetical protein
VLLKDYSIGELLLADGAGMLDSERGHGPMDAVMGLKVPFCGESPATDLTLEGPLPCVRSVVHFQGALAAEDPVADDALVRVSGLFVNVFHQLLQFGCL